jgi:hypothetical protein
MAQFDAPGIARRDGSLTNGRETGAYAIAQVIKLALTYAVGFSGLLSPLYMAAYKAGGAAGVVPVTFVINVIWGGMALLLFLALRAALRGVPAIVAGTGRESAFTSRGGEIGAFAIAYLILVVAILVLHSAYLASIYAELGRNGQRQLIMAIGLAISGANAVLVYPIFIGLRSAFCRR